MSQDSKQQPNVVFVLGGPGSGKGTQCSNIVRDYGFVHLSAGDLLRAEQQRETDNAELIKTFIKEGKIVPVEITVALIKQAIDENMAKGNYYFLVDGFPRNHNNLEGWEKLMSEHSNLSFCLFFDCPEEVMEQRLLNRGLTSGRADDNIDSIKKRFKTFVEETIPVVAEFEKRGKKRAVSATQSPDKVYADVQAVWAQDFKEVKLKPQTTFAFLKPDVVAAGTEAAVLEKITQAGFEIVSQKKFSLSQELAGEFYAEHKDREFYPGLVEFMTSGPVVALLLRKENAIAAWRSLLGPTNSLKAKDEKPESLRALFGTDGRRNACHGSDSFASAKREALLIFPELF